MQVILLKKKLSEEMSICYQSQEEKFQGTLPEGRRLRLPQQRRQQLQSLPNWMSESGRGE
jgi:hypothetical protein